MTQYDNRGKVSIWKNDNSKNEKAPILKGSIFAHRDIKEGEMIEVALWKNESDNEKAPTLRGNISDKREPQANGGGTSQPLSDEIPF